MSTTTTDDGFVHIISKDVDCPWCEAKAGEDCYFSERGADGVIRYYRSDRRGHIARLKKVPIAEARGVAREALLA